MGGSLRWLVPARRSSPTRLLLGPLLGGVSDRAPLLVQTNLFVGQGEGVGAGGEWGDWGRCTCTAARKRAGGKLLRATGNSARRSVVAGKGGLGAGSRGRRQLYTYS